MKAPNGVKTPDGGTPPRGEFGSANTHTGTLQPDDIHDQITGHSYSSTHTLLYQTQAGQEAASTRDNQSTVNEMRKRACHTRSHDSAETLRMHRRSDLNIRKVAAQQKTTSPQNRKIHNDLPRSQREPAPRSQARELPRGSAVAEQTP